MSDFGEGVRGYKVFYPDWTCRPDDETVFQYEVGKTYEDAAKPVLCHRGFHFFLDPACCWERYGDMAGRKFAEVLALGDIDDGGCPTGLERCTNRLKIVREIPEEEFLSLLNYGIGNSGGGRNTGNYNRGDSNAGDCNRGNLNAGEYNNGSMNTGRGNIGDLNSGLYNRGRRNTGWCNDGDYNAGAHNVGNWNTGDWNRCNAASGCFNTASPPFYLFNRPSAWTYADWQKSDARRVLDSMPVTQARWEDWDAMTDQERGAHPEAEATHGYLVDAEDYAERLNRWWRELDAPDRAAVLSVPNFDKTIFKTVTGIDADAAPEGSVP